MSSFLKSLNKLKKNVIIKNVFYLGIIQIVNYIFPIITIPYLVKVLGIEGFGTIAFSQVLASYICIISDYGFNMTATRDISLIKEDKISVNNIVGGVIYAKIFLAGICTMVAIPCILYMSIFSEFRNVFLISLLYVVGQIFFPTWLFQGMEKMGHIALFNSVFKFIFTGAVFLCVKSKHDMELVSWIYVLGSLVAGTSAFVYAVRIYGLTFVRLDIGFVKKLLIDGFDVFLPSFFSSVLSNGGVFILGVFHTPLLVGFYTAIDKLVKAGIALLSTITQSMFPNIAYKFSLDKKMAINSIYKIGKVVIGILIVVFCIMLFCSGLFLKILYNNEYIKYAYVLNVLLFWVIIAFINNFIGIQFLVGSGNGRYYRKAFLISGTVMICSFFCIKYWAINGVLFSTLTAELLLTCCMVYFIKKNRLTYD